MAPFAGWEMPVQFRGIAAEHEAVRNTVGAFDVSHMGQIRITDDHAIALLEHLLPAEPGKLEIGQMLYSVLCNEKGGIIDDLTVYRIAVNEFLLVVNASRTAVDLLWIEGAADRFEKVDVESVGDGSAILAVQGPAAETLLREVIGGCVAPLEYYSFLQTGGAFGPLLASRNGYSGEDGFEIICSKDQAIALWDAVLHAGAEPCGLGCRDTLRTEMGFCLYGNEIDESTDPLQARLGWTLRLDKAAAFIGKAALVRLREQLDRKRLVGLKLLERGIPRIGHLVLSSAGEVVGRVTSGTYSTTLKDGIALGYVDHSSARKGTDLRIEIRGTHKRAQVVSLPFVPSHVKKGKHAAKR
jgi:aminomethyltransferase